MSESVTGTKSEGGRRSLIQKGKLALIGVGLILILIVVLQNTEAVETKILFVTITVPRAVLLFGTAVAGYVLGIFTGDRFGK
ncbi:LapA family protein [Aporhodopirellula aestuarii]|uniref:DUF1049 domain-containing protein n=1 Tax=Aporhodopirellula aestuarii TaxID=2950107 RepID=A0ABT0U1Y0_9BACT|nr:hypothetical protein [Aporhodopirellula aestuarii]MCM2370872.1 hypothetical protein [Aporhodopirellula aestuarii]